MDTSRAATCHSLSAPTNLLSLLVDLFGYLEIILHGLVILSQSMAVGGLLFLLLLARPFTAELPGGARISRWTAQTAGWAALALLLFEGLTLALQAAVLMDTVDLTLWQVLGANFAIAGLVKCTAALLLGLCLLIWRRTPSAILLALAAVELAAATLSTHAAARIQASLPLMGVEALHQLGAAIWVGGIPSFIMVLASVHEGIAWRRVSARFSRMSMLGVLCILTSGVAMSIAYIGSWDAVYGTAFGVMVFAKVAMFGALLLLGFGNFLTTERLRGDPSASVLRMKRFAEVELGIGISIFFAAASLTSVPPGVDLTQDRVSWAEVVARNTPVWPRLNSPDYDSLALPQLQAQLDAEAARQAKAAPPASIPGSGELPPRNAADIAWSEYNHHWAGLFVVLIGVLALLNRAGLRWAGHWPLALLALAAFLAIRSDPEVWPMGYVGLWASLRDVEVLQHRMFVLLIIVFAVFEWSVRTGTVDVAKSGLGVPAAHGRRGRIVADAHACDLECERPVADRTDPYAPGAGRDRGRLGPLAGTAAVWARYADRRLGLAGVFPSLWCRAADLPGGVTRRRCS